MKKETKTKIKKILYNILLALVLTIIMFISTGCFNKELVRDPNQPDSCNDVRMFVKLASKSMGIVSKENTSAAVILNLTTSTYTHCRTDRLEKKKDIKFDKCLKIIYGDDLKQDKDKYTELKECTKL